MFDIDTSPIDVSLCGKTSGEACLSERDRVDWAITINPQDMQPSIGSKLLFMVRFSVEVEESSPKFY